MGFLFIEIMFVVLIKLMSSAVIWNEVVKKIITALLINLFVYLIRILTD